MWHFLVKASTPGLARGRSRRMKPARSCDTRAMRSLLALASCLTLALIPATVATAQSGNPDDVHADPGSPAAKEYTVPIDAGRHAGGTGGSHGTSGGSGSSGGSGGSGGFGGSAGSNGGSSGGASGTGAAAGPRFGVGIAPAAAATGSSSSSSSKDD